MTAILAPYWVHKERLLLRDGESCGICRKPIDLRLGRPNPGSFTVDHVNPRSLGGCDHVENLRPAHLGCNSRRGNRITKWSTCRQCRPAQPEQVGRTEPSLRDQSHQAMLTAFVLVCVLALAGVIVGIVAWHASYQHQHRACTATEQAATIAWNVASTKWAAGDGPAPKDLHFTCVNPGSR